MPKLKRKMPKMAQNKKRKFTDYTLAYKVTATNKGQINLCENRGLVKYISIRCIRPSAGQAAAQTAPVPTAQLT